MAAYARLSRRFFALSPLSGENQLRNSSVRGCVVCYLTCSPVPVYQYTIRIPYMFVTGWPILLLYATINSNMLLLYHTYLVPNVLLLYATINMLQQYRIWYRTYCCCMLPLICYYWIIPGIVRTAVGLTVAVRR